MHNPLCPDLRRQLEATQKSFTPDEERRLLHAMKQAEPSTRLLCELLYLTGCRLSEALAIRLDCLDTERHLVVFHTLKQRDKPMLRAVPVPQSFLQRLVALPTAPDGRFWAFSRWTARRRIQDVLAQAGIPEAIAHSKTFRHSYNDRGRLQGIPDHVRRALLGHRTQRANDCYGALIGHELHAFARQAWGVLA